ncbi:hypothetical protein Pcinc_042017 [Petrolisthes cinctipes]|uniref:Uncharacterized protein n=1 Tax=Petrolisthes cinctipes TaxID=88211 RepID=A0AAE1BIU7_PETCI|nr:hypothetical protein Pcinc_042017 [Petrolisthes cinctipes]
MEGRGGGEEERSCHCGLTRLYVTPYQRHPLPTSPPTNVTPYQRHPLPLALNPYHCLYPYHRLSTLTTVPNPCHIPSTPTNHIPSTPTTVHNPYHPHSLYPYHCSYNPNHCP